MKQAFIKNILQRTLTCISALVLIIPLVLYAPSCIISLMLATLCLWILVVEWPVIAAFNPLVLWPFTSVYIIFPFFCMHSLYQEPHLKKILFYVIALVFAHDTCAYFVGNLLGKNLLAPTISPKKTWEGFIGGCSAVFIVLILFPLVPISFTFITIGTIAISILATLGDLFESQLKRNVGIKDSGSLLPGHGGLLDRFDALLFVIPVIWIIAHFLY